VAAKFGQMENLFKRNCHFCFFALVLLSIFVKKFSILFQGTIICCTPGVLA